MEVKNFVFCFLFFTNVINLAEEDILDNKNFSISTVEKNNLINKNNWNTRKWGNLYFLFPHVSLWNIKKSEENFSIFGKINNKYGILLNFLFSGVIEYKYMFHKNLGVNIRINLNNMDIYINKKTQNENGGISLLSEILTIRDFSFFSFEPSLEWIYGRKGKKIFSGSFCPVGFCFMQQENGDLINDFLKEGWIFGFVLLKYEYDRRFYLNFVKIKAKWSTCMNDKGKNNLSEGDLSIEFGLNIIGVNDWRKKEKNK